MHILIIEDDISDLNLIKQTLEHSVKECVLFDCQNLKDSLEFLSESTADIIILDLGLPDSDGIETFHQVFKAASMIPIIVLSGINDEDVAIMAVKDGAQDCLVKNEITSRSLSRSIAYSFERKHTQDKLEKIQQLESINILAGGLAHDFNNILSAIMGNISLAKFKMNSNSKEYHYLDTALNACEKATYLTGQMLLFAKSGAPILKSTNIADLIKDSAEFVLAGSNVSCTFDFPEQEPVIEIDKGQISQVIQNLIINANQAMPDGGKIHNACSSIIVENSELPPLQKGKYLKICVEDNGPGIGSGVLEKIFEPYFTTKKNGHGLGLAVSYSVVLQHGGLMTVRSIVGEGTVFLIYLPMVDSLKNSKLSFKF